MGTAPKFGWLVLIIIIIAASLAAIVYTRHAKQQEFRDKITALTSELSKHQSNKEELRRRLAEPRLCGDAFERSRKKDNR